MTTTSPPATEGRPGPTKRSRRRNTLIGAVVVVVLFAAAVAIGQFRTSAPKPPSDHVGTQLDRTLPADIMHLPLVNEYGKPTDLASFNGKIVVLADFMTLCQETCPITTARLSQADQAVTKAGLADKVQFVEITVDPKRDTPTQLHAYRSFADLPPNFSLLTGTAGSIATLWKALGVGYDTVPEHNPPSDNWRTGKPLTYDVQHTDAVMYFDPAGQERYVIVGMPVGKNAPLNAGEKAFLDAQGRANLIDTSDEVWTTDDAVQVVSWLSKKHIHAVA